MADNRLELVVEVDTNRANASIKSVNASLSSMEASAVKTARGATQGIDGMTAAMVKGATAGNLLADAIKSALNWAKDFTAGSVMMAAENAKTEASLKALANAHGVGAAAAARQVAAIEEIGFEYTEAAHAVERLIVADLELSKAQGLAKLAKDAAAVQDVSAGEAMEAIVLAIESGASRGLRTLGLFVDFQKEAQIAELQLGRALTETEEKQIRYNAVMREGAKIQGAHAAASQTAEGQLSELRREFNNLREDIGAQFQDEFTSLIGSLRELVGWLKENTDLLKKFGEVALGVAGALATYALADKIMALAKSIAALNLASLNPYALLATGVVAAGAIVYNDWKTTQERLQAQFDEMQRKALREDLFSGRTSVDALRKQGMTDDQIRELITGNRLLPGEQPWTYEGPKIAIKTGSEPDLEALKRAAEIRKRQLEVERESMQALAEARRRSLTGFARDVAEVQEQVRRWSTFVDDKGNEQKIALTRQAWENVIAQLRERLKAWQQEVGEELRKQLNEELAAEEEAFRRKLELESRLFAERLAYNQEIARRNLDHLGQMLGIEEQRAGLARDAQLRALEATDAQTIEQKVAVEQRKAAIEIEYLTRVHEIRMRLFDLETSRMVIEEEAQLKRLGYRADEIQARIAELTAQRDEIRRFQQEATDAAIQGARETAAIRQAQLIRDHNQQIFDSFKRQAEGVFDALLTKSQSIWSAIGNSLKTALLTAIKDVVSSRVAAMLMQLFTGTRVSLAGGGASGGGTLGRLGGLGGLLGVGAAPVFGAGSIVGGPGGTGGFAGPVASTGVVGMGRWHGLVGLPGIKNLLTQIGNLGSRTVQAAGTMITVPRGIGGAMGGALLLGGGLLGLAGLQRGGVSGLAMTTAGGAMIGFKYGGPLGAAIGAGIGAVAGLVRLFVKSAEEKAREKIKATYGVDIRDKGVLRQIVDIAKHGFGGNLEAAIRSQQIRDLVELYALSTGQSTSGLPATVRTVSLLQQGGSLFQSSSGSLTLGRIGGSAPLPAAPPTVINITVPGAKEFFEKETVRVVVENPRAVQSAAMTATKASAGRREMTGLQLSPGLILS
jgi:hypothetical protein